MKGSSAYSVGERVVLPAIAELGLPDEHGVVVLVDGDTLHVVVDAQYRKTDTDDGLRVVFSVDVWGEPKGGAK